MRQKWEFGGAGGADRRDQKAGGGGVNVTRTEWEGRGQRGAKDAERT